MAEDQPLDQDALAAALENRTILAVVESLDEHPDVGSALDAAGVDHEQRAPYLHALGVLADSQMLVAR